MIDLFKHPIFIFASLAFWVNQYLEKSRGIFVPIYHAYGDDLMAKYEEITVDVFEVSTHF